MKHSLPTIHELRKRGLKVRCYVQRYVIDMDDHNKRKLVDWHRGMGNYYELYLIPKGGCYHVIVEKDNMTYAGVALCHPDDLFSKVEGRKKALQKLLNRNAKELGF